MKTLPARYRDPHHCVDWLCLMGICALTLLSGCSKPPISKNPPDQHAYVWQRSWNSNVVAAVQQNGAVFNSLIVLKAEIHWKDSKPLIQRVGISYPVLKRTGCDIGLAIRINSYPGPFAAQDPTSKLLVELLKEALDEAATNSCRISEIQLDFDCPDSKLGDYEKWVRAMREGIKPTPLTITALPSWLNQRACKFLLRSTDGFVLQVHSLERPKMEKDTFTLCNPIAAERAVEKAATFGVPFQVSLPTYGYLLAFETNGTFVGLSAEGPQLQWREGLTLKEVRSSPAEIAGLVERWNHQHPAAMRGIIWYRLPVEGDKLNWSWPTLASVKAGRVPRHFLTTASRSSRPDLYEIELINRGDGDYQGPVRLKVRWRQARVLASDGWQGFTASEPQADHLEFKSPELLIPAGERMKAGWLRLDQHSEVTIEHEP